MISDNLFVTWLFVVLVFFSLFELKQWYFQCESGWYGIDCSIPSAIAPMQEWPAWLRPSTVELPDRVHLTSNSMSVKAVVKKKRPLIYVYELPPEFNSHLLEVNLLSICCFRSLIIPLLFIWLYLFGRVGISNLNV